MPSRKTSEQVMTWLNSMAADRDSLNGINAELCINTINDLKRQLDKNGAIINRMKAELNILREEHAGCYMTGITRGGTEAE